MFRPRPSSIAAAALVLLLLAGVADARGHRSRYSDVPPTYTALKAGGYGLSGLVAEDDLDGLFLGFEAGVRPSPFIEFAVTADWFRRRDAVSEVFLLDSPYPLPVEGVIDLEQSSIDLIPVGALLRLRFPAAGGHFVPYISGALTYDLLRMSASASTPDGALIFQNTEYFTGAGHSVAGGVELTLGSTTAFVFELGYHDAKPDKQIEWNGNPIRARVDAGGGYARVGLKFGLR